MAKRKRKYVKKSGWWKSKTAAPAPAAPSGEDEIAHEITPAPDDEAFARASRAAAGAPPPGEEPIATPVEPEPLTPDALIVVLELIYSVGVDLAASAYEVDDPALVERLSKIGSNERRILEVTAPFAMRDLEKAQALMERFGGLAFGAVVVLGLVSRNMILKRWAQQHSAKKKAADGNFGFATPEEAERAARDHYSRTPEGTTTAQD